MNRERNLLLGMTRLRGAGGGWSEFPRIPVRSFSSDGQFRARLSPEPSIPVGSPRGDRNGIGVRREMKSGLEAGGILHRAIRSPDVWLYLQSNPVTTRRKLARRSSLRHTHAYVHGVFFFTLSSHFNFPLFHFFSRLRSHIRFGHLVQCEG